MKLVDEVETFGEVGNIDKAQELMTYVDRLHEERKTLLVIISH